MEYFVNICLYFTSEKIENQQKSVSNIDERKRNQMNRESFLDRMEGQRNLDDRKLKWYNLNTNKSFM